MPPIKTAAEIFRRYVTNGVPGSGINPVNKDDVVAWGSFLESTIGQVGLGYSTLALLNGDLAHGAGTLSFVYNDATAAYNGLYQKSGASGSGTWTRIGDLWETVVNLNVTGGTANAITATAIENPILPGAKLFLLTPTAANTGPTTININGTGAVAIKNAFGVDLAANSLLAGSQVLMAWQTDHYQLLLSANPDASAFTASCTASAAAASASASAAASSAASLSGVVGMSPPGGRLTLVSGVDAPSSDQAAAASIYYTPSASEWIRIFDGTNDVLRQFAELTLALDGTSGHTGYHQSGKIYDLWVYWNGSTAVLGTGPAWASDTSRGTGAGTSEYEFYKGLPRNKNTLTNLRFGSASGNTVSVPARQATLVGSFRATADGQASDTQLRRLLSNAYNPAPRKMFANAETLGSSWAYSTFSFRQVHANTANQTEVLQCLSNRAGRARAIGTSQHSAGGVLMFTGIGINSTSVNSGKGGLHPIVAANLATQGSSEWEGNYALGYTKIVWLEAAAASGTTTWLAGDATIAAFSSGLQAECWN
ncbi:hypothetical protein [Bradyrhizobium cosmicum]|uniref:P023 n=1 Tax=Bradyrhizobium cosmicum TaxID=1404864 RepID=A0AAI8QBW2_9BRAD|nr:hypothetical protein [Bradyrhizobium cosmicum]BAL76013.1 p023 [Bradyrhizobium cosmicum]